MLQTRTTLIKRLKDWQDQASWQAFFDTYWKLIYGFAVQCGLNGTEAEDVVQETMISVAKQMPNFEYNRSLGSFKAWLLKTTRWRIIDQFRRRDRMCHSGSNSDSTTRVAMNNVADRNHLDLEAMWDAEWKITLFEAASRKVKRSVDPKQYQIFDLCVRKEWEPARIARTYGIAVGQVYVTKHRVGEAIKDEVERLKKAMN